MTRRQWNWRKSLVIAAILAVFSGPLLYSFGLLPSLNLVFFNWTRSAPVGIYLAADDQTLVDGDYVVLRPPEAAKPYLYGRHWTTAPYLLKRVAALPGERYEWKLPWLLAGDKAAFIFRTDPDGLPLPVPPDGVYAVPARHVLLVSWEVKQSFDSRYFGPVAQAQVVRKVVPWLTLPPELEKWLLE
jgi:conjugative transfer signal peptidase TraF